MKTPAELHRTPRLARSRDTDERQRAVVLVGSVILGFVFMGIGVPFSILLGLPPGARMLFVPAFGVLAGWFVNKFSMTIVEASGRFALALVWPSGKSTPYQRDFSSHQALVASGEMEEAFAAYERTIAQEPDNAEIRRQAIELHLRQGDPRRAEALLLELRRSPSMARTHELYATHRLADLYLGPLGGEGRALVELRRLAERFAGTPEAEGARRAIATLKQRPRDDA